MSVDEKTMAMIREQGIKLAEALPGYEYAGTSVPEELISIRFYSNPTRWYHRLFGIDPGTYTEVLEKETD